MDLPRERPPVVLREAAGQVEDLAEGGRRHVASEVDAVEAEPARDRDVLGGQVDEERTALVRARSVALGEREQLVGDDDSRDLSLVEGACRRPREEIDVGEHRDRQLLAPDPAQQLVVLARVPADLVDDEARTRLDLLPQLEVLRHHLTLAPLVVRHDAAEEEVRPVEPRVGRACIRKPLIHLGEEAEQADRVDVEHRRGEPLVPRDRIVAGEREDVVEPLRAQLPAATLERVAVPVLAREMDDHLLAARDQIGPERVGREHRVPARIVGDREHVDARVGGELPRHLHHPAAAVRRDQPAARDHLRGDDERTGPCELFTERDHRAAPAFPISVCLIYHRRMADLQVLDAETAVMVERVCDAIVPGSARVRPAVYVDALLARMDEGTRGAALAAFASVADGEIEEHVGTPEFRWVRALAIEAFYSDFVAPGVDATGAWAEIDFNTPLATRLAKDWSYLGIG